MELILDFISKYGLFINMTLFLTHVYKYGFWITWNPNIKIQLELLFGNIYFA